MRLSLCKLLMPDRARIITSNNIKKYIHKQITYVSDNLLCLDYYLGGMQFLIGMNP